MRATGYTRRVPLVGLFFVLGGAPPALGAEPDATPTPTPPNIRRELHLGEYADRVTLDRSGLRTTAGSVVITNELVAGIGDRGTVTTGISTPTSSGPTPTTDRATPAPAGPGRRGYWQRRVRDQRQVISKVASELALLDAKIDALEDAAFQGGIRAKSKWVKLAEARGRRRVVDRRLRNERSNLSAIIREARREGAEPGWFR